MALSIMLRAARVTGVGKGVWLIGLVAGLLAGCDAINGLGQRVLYQVSGPQRSLPSDADMAVLLKRLRSLRSSFLSSVEASRKGGQPHIIVDNIAVDDALSGCIARHLGTMTIHAGDPAAPWLTEANVERVSASHSDGYHFLDFSIDDRAVERFARLTREHVGERLTVNVDGKKITRAQIQAELGKRFRVTINGKGQAQCMAAVLSHGELSQPYKLLRQR